MRRVVGFTTVLLVAIVLAVRAWAAAPIRTFEGYWMGVDPVDGGDQRRSFIRQDDGSIAAVGRDSFLRLCDESDRGVIAFSDGAVIGKGIVATDDFQLTCFSNNAVLLLKARYELVNDAMMIEHLTTQEGAEVQTMVLHKVSR